jgi:ABC-type methionine transport system ATPase subunit
VTLRVKLTFRGELVKEPLLGVVAKRFDVLPNVRRANVEEASGWIVCELDGDGAEIERAVAFLREAGVDVELLGGDVVE